MKLGVPNRALFLSGAIAAAPRFSRGCGIAQVIIQEENPKGRGVEVLKKPRITPVEFGRLVEIKPKQSRVHITCYDGDLPPSEYALRRTVKIQKNHAVVISHSLTGDWVRMIPHGDCQPLWVHTDHVFEVGDQ